MRRKHLSIITILGMTVLSILALANQSVAQGKCKSVNGHLDSVAVDLDGNPDTLETAGTFIGGIQATFEFDNFLPISAGNANIPSVSFYLGDIDLILKDGTVIRGIDSGTLDFATGELTELTTFIEKDGVAGDFGRIVVSGIFDLSTGTGDSDYHGVVCFND